MRTPISWTWVIIALIAFWPIGLVLLFTKLSQDRTATFTCGRRLRTVSIVLFIVGGLILIGARSAGMGVGVLFIIGGFLVLRAARKNDARSNLYRQYINLVANHGVTSVDAIANAVGLPWDAVMHDLQLMINHGYFSGAQLDGFSRSIVWNVAHHMGSHSGPHTGPFATPLEETFATMFAGPGTPPPPGPVSRIVRCDGCGANNKVDGAVGMCEYCGSHLK